jgi:hypothetical protein
MIVSTKFSKENNMDKTEIGFDKTNTFPIMVKHHIVPAADGQLEHWMDDKLRATVPPESWDDYCKEWPVCRDVVDSMRLPRTEKPETILQSTVDAMLRASQDLPDDSGIILAVANETPAAAEVATQNTEDPDHV